MPDLHFLQRPTLGLSILCALTAGAAAQAVDRPTPETRPVREDAFVNFESTSIHPIRVSADGTRLYAVQTPDARLSVFSLRDPGQPALLHEIQVGLEPVSVTERTATEVWVANLLSDSVSIVNPQTGERLGTVRVEDEPSDIAFAGGRAFIACATVDRVLVFDASTRVQVGAIDVPAKDPRALAVSADGTKVYVLSRRSGNGTTILGESAAPAPPPPTNSTLPPAPQTGLIVRIDDPLYASSFSYSLPDEDVHEIDVSTLAITDAWAHVGTTNYDLAVAADGSLFVASTDALNEVRFEPNLRGHTVDHLLVRLDGAGVHRRDLNAGLDYGQLPNPSALQTSLAEPTGLALDGAFAWVAAHGSDRVAKVRLSDGVVTSRVEVGSPAGSTRATEDMRGPRGLALHPSGEHLYVHNRLSDTLSVIDTASASVVAEQALGAFDPVPNSVRRGRKFLYDARLSGNGTISCAVCHVDGDTDGLAWDLGDPGGLMSQIPTEWQQGFQPGVTPPFFPDLHPMKGPMVTQPLRDLEERLHWRGDRGSFAEFNGTFDSLMGGELLPDDSMALFTSWVETVLYPPNPHQNLDRTLSQAGGFQSQQRGFDRFVGPNPAGGPSCVECHELGSGTNGFVRNFPQGSNQPMRIGPLRDFYRKTGFERSSNGPLKAGFGRFHNGDVGELSDLGLGGTGAGSLAMTAFLMAWDTGTAPIVGVEAVLDAASSGTQALAARLDLLEERAELGEADLMVQGRVRGRERGYLFDPTLGLYRPDRRRGAGVTRAELEALASLPGTQLTFLACYPGTGYRMALDRDLDGQLNRDEL